MLLLAGRRPGGEHLRAPGERIRFRLKAVQIARSAEEQRLPCDLENEKWKVPSTQGPSWGYQPNLGEAAREVKSIYPTPGPSGIITRLMSGETRMEWNQRIISLSSNCQNTYLPLRAEQL